MIRAYSALVVKSAAELRVSNHGRNATPAPAAIN